MLPIPPIGLLLAALFFLMRSNLGGLVLGGVLAMGAMHLWPETMETPYRWVGEGIDVLGLREIIDNTGETSATGSHWEAEGSKGLQTEGSTLVDGTSRPLAWARQGLESLDGEGDASTSVGSSFFANRQN